MNKLAVLFLFLTLTSSCILQSPKYTYLENVMNLNVGMSKDQVETVLDLEPYDLKAYTDSSNVFTYIYRVNDRKTLSLFTKRKNGIHSRGKYVQLFVTYTKDNSKCTYIETCSLCPDNLVNKSTVDFEKIFTFLTVTAPVILVYIGLQK
jgi:hypothetical protein